MKVIEINIREKKGDKPKEMEQRQQQGLGRVEGALLVGEGEVGCVCKWFK